MYPQESQVARRLERIPDKLSLSTPQDIDSGLLVQTCLALRLSAHGGNAKQLAMQRSSRVLEDLGIALEAADKVEHFGAAEEGGVVERKVAGVCEYVDEVASHRQRHALRGRQSEM